MIVFVLLLPIAGVVWPASRAHVSLFRSNLLEERSGRYSIVLRKTARAKFSITLHFHMFMCTAGMASGVQHKGLQTRRAEKALEKVCQDRPWGMVFTPKTVR